MAKYRSLQTSFWEDENVLENYTPEERFFFLYVLENKDVTQCGIYTFSIKKAALHTGYPEEKIRELLVTHQNVHKTIRYNSETKEIAVRNFLKYNSLPSPSVQKCIKKGFECVKDKSLVTYVLYRGNVEEVTPVVGKETPEPDTMIQEMPVNAPNDTEIYDDRRSPEGHHTVYIPSIDSGGEKEKIEKEKNKNIIIEKRVCITVDNVDNPKLLSVPPNDEPEAYYETMQNSLNIPEIIKANYPNEAIDLAMHMHMQIRNKRLEHGDLGYWKTYHPNTFSWFKYLAIIHENENASWDDIAEIIDYVANSRYWLYRINSAKDLLLYFNNLAIESGKRTFIERDTNNTEQCSNSPPCVFEERHAITN